MTSLAFEIKEVVLEYRAFAHRQTFFHTLSKLANGAALHTSIRALDGVSLRVERGERIALLGRNGSGKSSLLRVLSQILPVDQGEVQVYATMEPFLTSTAGLDPNLTVEDNLHLLSALFGVDGRLTNERVERILLDLGLGDHRYISCARLSTGQRTKLPLTVFMQTEAEILLFDEPIAHVDSAFREHCHTYFRRLADNGTTCVFTSHIDTSIFDLCTRAIWLDRGRIVADGPFYDVFRDYEAA